MKLRPGCAEEYRKRVEQAVAVLQGDIRELSETVRGEGGFGSTGNK